MSTYHLTVITPQGKVFEGEVESLTAPGREGFFGVLAGHAPMAVALKEGPLTVTVGDKKLYYAIQPGILEINQKNQVVLLADFAVPAASFEEAKSMAVHSARN